LIGHEINIVIFKQNFRKKEMGGSYRLRKNRPLEVRKIEYRHARIYIGVISENFRKKGRLRRKVAHVTG
jgi:hypothetical protein